MTLRRRLIFSRVPRLGDTSAVAGALGALAVDMETSALYRIAAQFGARALSLLTVVDHVATGELTDYSERQALFTDMTRLALEVAAES